MILVAAIALSTAAASAVRASGCVPSVPRPCVVMADAVRWPDIVRAFVSAKFASVDLDSSGEVDRNELVELFKALLPGASEAKVEKELADFFEQFDKDNSGDIDEEEFMNAVMSLRLLNSDMRLKEQVFVDVLNTYEASGTRLLAPDYFSALEAQLEWEGSDLPTEYAKKLNAFYDD